MDEEKRKEIYKEGSIYVYNKIEYVQIEDLYLSKSEKVSYTGIFIKKPIQNEKLSQRRETDGLE